VSSRLTRLSRAALLAAWVLAGGCARSHSDPAQGAVEAVVDVRVEAVTARPFASALEAPGQWRSGGELVVAAPFAGMVEAMSAHVGDRVRAGQSLGMLVTRESWSALHGAELLAREAHDEAARAEAERALTLARKDRVSVPIVAPQAGVVLRRALEPGAQVSEAAELFAIATERNIVFEVRVTAADAGRVHAGQDATILEAGSKPREATVQRVLPTADSADQGLRVWLSPRGGPPPSLEHFGSARIATGAAHRASAVPDSAIVEDDLSGVRRVALVGADHRIAWTELTLGAAEGGWHEVLRPALAPGALVVIEGQRGLPDSTRVQWTH
jgi:multidrug efflux pump subunit AcrA (membrane-fusion protein)